MISIYTVMKHSLPRPPILESIDAVEQQIRELGTRIRASIEPPIAEIEETLEKYLGAGALLVGDTLTPSAEGRRAVQSAVAASTIMIECEDHVSRHTKLDPCFLKAWPGIWSWLQFFEDQCYQRDKYGDSLGHLALLSICSILPIMSRSNAVRARLTSTPGVVALIAKYWKEEGHDPGIERSFRRAGMPRPFTKALDMLLFLHKQTFMWTPDIIMASGSAKAAAINAIKNLNDVWGDKPSDFKTICRHVSLVSHFCRSTELRLAMLVQDMVPSTAKLLSWLETQPTRVADVEDTICMCTHLCLFTLQGIMKINGPTSSVVQAFDADILPTILKLACRVARLTNDISSICSSLLSNTLCQFLVFKSVVRSAAKALKRVDRLKLDDSSGGPIWKAWVIFKTLARERIYILDNMEKGAGRMQRCHRVDCGDKRDNLLRCSGCLSVYYCNRACQKRDWAAHKPACQEAQQYLHDWLITDAIKTGDCHFIGKLVVHEICTNSADVAKMLLNAMKLNAPLPASEFAFILDYTQVPVKITVVLVGELPAIGNMLPIIEEASQSNGQLMVAKAEVQGGSRLEYLGFTIPAPLKQNEYRELVEI